MLVKYFQFPMDPVLPKTTDPLAATGCILRQVVVRSVLGKDQ